MGRDGSQVKGPLYVEYDAFEVHLSGCRLPVGRARPFRVRGRPCAGAGLGGTLWFDRAPFVLTFHATPRLHNEQGRKGSQ